MKNLKLSYLKIALIILTVYVFDEYVENQPEAVLFLVLIFLLIEFIFGDLFSKAAKELTLDKSKLSSWLIMLALVLLNYMLFILATNYLSDNNPGSLMILAAALIYGMVCFNSYVVYFINNYFINKDRDDYV